MPTKTKGMISLEVAIIVAIILVIAIAVGWYLYTTFASAGAQSGLVVVNATVYTGGGTPTLCLGVVPQGASSVQIASVQIGGGSFSASPNSINSPTKVKVVLTGVNVAVGQVLSGRVVLTSGGVAPFTANVVADNPKC
ncbi:MAG: hypothetical protein QXP31_10635 [Pyrobaculum sp.]